MDACVAELQGGVGFQLVIAGKEVIQSNHFLRVQGQNIVYRILIYRLQKQQQFAVIDDVAIIDMIDCTIKALAVFEQQLIYHIVYSGILCNRIKEVNCLLFPLLLFGTVNLTPLFEIALR